MRVQVRIVAGALRGRKLTCDIGPDLRPTPQMVREALFSILGNAVPDRPFYDVFAGTGVVGLEALSRGATVTEFVERDFRLAQEIDRHLKAFACAEQARVRRVDAYRWADHWAAPAEPVTLFLSPPYPDLERRPDDLLGMVATLQQKAAPGSVLVLQAEESEILDRLPDPERWDRRRYGRNWLVFWSPPEEET
ncbi:MAG: RsmD family RNA methyltransferase [Gemmataceae bacterium]|nr:RsmD family RNA methyltransferase [Gemmataceae bacterium]